MKPVNPKDLNRETIRELAKNHVIIDQVLNMLASPNYPVSNFEEALILMVIYLTELNESLEQQYLSYIQSDTRPFVINLDKVTPDDKNLILEKLLKIIS